MGTYQSLSPSISSHSIEFTLAGEGLGAFKRKRVFLPTRIFPMPVYLIDRLGSSSALDACHMVMNNFTCSAFAGSGAKTDHVSMYVKMTLPRNL